MSNSLNMFARAQQVTPGGVHSPVRAFKNVATHPRFIERAEGAYLYDVDGQRYVDFCMAWGPLVYGHTDPDVAAAVHQALSRGWSYGTAEPYSLEFAEFLCAKLPWVEKIRFVNSGTEAVMSALRVARAATGRNKILKFDGCYHGHVDSMLVRAGSGLAEMAAPDSAGVGSDTAALTLVAPLNDLAAVEAIFSEHGADIAAVIIEPLPANNGLLIQSPEFLIGLATVARKHGALVIFDEVISGFRVAFGGMAEVTGIKPDLVTYGKILGGGFPVGAFAGRRDLMDLVAPQGPVYQAGTLSANPVAMAAGFTTIKKLDTESPYAALAAKTTELCRQLAKLPFHVQNFGSLFWLATRSEASPSEEIRSIAQIPVQQKAAYAELYPHLLDEGYYLAPSGYEVGFVSMAHSEEHLQGLAAALRRVSTKLYG